MAARFRNENLIEVNDWSEVPEFDSEAEEAEFWGTHGLGQRLLDQMGPLDDVLPPPRPRRRRIAAYVSEFSRVIDAPRSMPVREPRPEIAIDRRVWLRAS
jgi:hypothetical protein